MECKYIVVESVYRNGDDTRKSYGVAAIDTHDKCSIVLKTISDISSDLSKVEDLARKCNMLKLDVCHLYDIVEDYLNDF